MMEEELKWITREAASKTVYFVPVLAYKKGFAETIVSQNPINTMEWGRHAVTENGDEFVLADTQPDFILNYHPLPSEKQAS